MIDVHDASTGAHAHRLTAEQRAALDDLLTRDPEGWASMKGLLATLSLPALTSGRRREVQALVHYERGVDVGEWQRIDRVYFRPGQIQVAQGVNGHTLAWAFPQPGPVPRWTLGAVAARHGLPGDDGAR